MKKDPHAGAPAPSLGIGFRDDVRLLANRCPFCRDDVSQEAEGWVACQGCLTRHHTPCWQEAGCCSSCGAERLLAQQAKTRRPGKAILARLAYVSLGFMLALGLVVGAVSFVAYQVHSRSQASSVLTSTHRARLVDDGVVVQVTDGTAYGAFIMRSQSSLPEQARYEYRYVDGQGRVFSGLGEARRTPTPLGGSQSPRVAFGPFSLEWSMSSEGAGWIYPGLNYVRVTPYDDFVAAEAAATGPYTDSAGRQHRDGS